jgi:hypothetical protein
MKSTAKSECILGGLPWEGHWAHQEKHVLLWKCQKMTTLSANSEIQFLIFQGRLAAGPENKHSSHAKSTLLETRPAPTRAMAAASEKSATTKVTRRDSFLCARTVLQNAPSQNHPFRLHKTPTSKKCPLETPWTKCFWADGPKDKYTIFRLKMMILQCKSHANSKYIFGGLPWEGHGAHQVEQVLLWKCQKTTTLSINSPRLVQNKILTLLPRRRNEG